MKLYATPSAKGGEEEQQPSYHRGVLLPHSEGEWVSKTNLTVTDDSCHVHTHTYVSSLTLACSWVIRSLPGPVGQAAKSPMPQTQIVAGWALQHHHGAKLSQPTVEQAVGHVIWQDAVDAGAVHRWKVKSLSHDKKMKQVSSFLCATFHFLLTFTVSFIYSKSRVKYFYGENLCI